MQIYRNNFTEPKPIECCASDGHDLARDLAAKAGCFPIRIPAEDPFYGAHNQRCMDFMRSSNDVSNGCNAYGPANQVNNCSNIWNDFNFPCMTIFL